MKKYFTAAIILAILGALPAAAQLKFGVKLGCDVERMSFNSSMLDSDNRCGFTGGVMFEFCAPVINLGFDISALYVRRNARFMDGLEEHKVGRDYVEIPLNIKYKLGVPAIENFVKPFVTTGPSVAFLTSSRTVTSAYRNNECDFAWNFGFGLELFKRVQVAASYGLGLSKTIQNVVGVNSADNISGKNRYWTVTAAYLF